MKLLISVLLIEGLLFGAVRKADREYYRGINLFKELKYEEAIPRFKAAYRDNSENRDALYRLGLSYAKLNRHGNAVKVFKKLLPEKGFEFVHFEVGKSYMALRERKKAYDSFNDSIRKGVRVDESYFLKGYMAYRGKKMKLSLTNLKKIRKESALYQASRYYAGIVTYRQAIKGSQKTKQKNAEDPFVEPKKYFNEVIALNKTNLLGKKAQTQLANMNRLDSPVGTRRWDFNGRLSHEYDDNVLNENDIDNPQVTTKSAIKGTANLTAGYKVYEVGHWYSKTTGVIDVGKYYSSDSVVYSSDSASFTAMLNSSYKNRAYGKNYKINLDYSFAYFMNDEDADKSYAFSSYTNTVTPAARYKVLGNWHTTVKFPVALTTNKSESEGSNSMSTKASVLQDLNFNKLTSSLTLEYDMYNSKTNSNDKKTYRAMYNLSYPVWRKIVPSLTLTYSLSDYNEGTKENDTGQNAALNVAMSFRKLKVATKFTYDRSAGNTKYSKYKLGLDLSYTL